MPYVNVDVHVDLDDFATDDLEAELMKRGQRIETEPAISVHQIYEAFYVGDEGRAMEMTKSYVQAATGRVIP